MLRLLRRKLRVLRALGHSVRRHFILATRGSALALWQAGHVKACLEALDAGVAVSLNVIKTRGDIIQDVPLARVGGKGLFVKEIEDALLDGRADLAVHSVKDIPVLLPDGLILGCIPPRENAADCFVSFHYPDIDALPEGAHVGTSSLRRQAQLLSLRPDLRISALRGNVDTRLRKLEEGGYDAIILAFAGLRRLNLSARYMLPLAPERLLPAVGQGALGIECREDHYDLLVLLASLEDRASRVCVDAERGFLAELDGGCQVPIAAHAVFADAQTLRLDALVAEPDGGRVVSGRMTGPADDAAALGRRLARDLLSRGARAILDNLYSQQ